MRLNAYLARAGVASRRGADELIKAGRVTVNGAAGELNTFVAATDDGARSTAPGRQAGARARPPPQAAGVVTTARDPEGRPTVVELVGGDAARSCPSAGSTRTRRARCCSRTTGRSRTGWRIRGTASRRPTSRTSRVSRRDDVVRRARGGCRARRRAHRSRARAPARPITPRARAARGPEPPGAADVRGGRAPGRQAAPQRLRRARPWPAAAGRWRALTRAEVTWLRRLVGLEAEASLAPTRTRPASRGRRRG